MRILVVEDDKETCAFLKSSLEEECFVVDTAEDGEKGFNMARINDYDLILLDHILPHRQGLEICEGIRKVGKDTPVLILSVKSELDHKITLLESGADDYVTKPYSFKELLARIRAILRRPKDTKKEVLVIEDMVLDSQAQTVLRNNKSIYLTRKEFILLEYLMRNKGKVLSRGMIMEHVWDSAADPFSNTIEAHILNLRKKMDVGFKKKIIHSVPGRGYKIDVTK